MARLEDLTRGASVKGILPDCLVAVVDVKWHGSQVVELTYNDSSGRLGNELLYRDREPSLETWAPLAASGFRGLRITSRLGLLWVQGSAGAEEIPISTNVDYQSTLASELLDPYEQISLDVYNSVSLQELECKGWL